MRTKVLVVDDDADLREEVARLLFTEGYDVVAARDGREAMHEARVHSLQGIVLDLHMPQLDGRSFQQELLADPALAAIPLVVVSGSAEGRRTALAMGAHAFIAKPFSAETLLAALRTCRPSSSSSGRAA